MVSSFEFPNVLAWTKGQTPALAAFIAVNRCDIKRVPLNVKGLKGDPGHSSWLEETLNSESVADQLTES